MALEGLLEALDTVELSGGQLTQTGIVSEIDADFYYQYCQSTSDVRDRIRPLITPEVIRETASQVRSSMGVFFDAEYPHLDVMTGRRLGGPELRALWRLLGVEGKKSGDTVFFVKPLIRRRLVEFGVFGPSLDAENNQKEILDDIVLRQSGSGKVDSYYFGEDCGDALSGNRSLLLKSKVYDTNELGLAHLDQITRDHVRTNKVIWDLLGIAREGGAFQISEVRHGLANLDPDKFSPSLTDYGDPSKIISDIISRKTDRGSFDSYYFSEECGDALASNRRLLLESKVYAPDELRIIHLDQISSSHVIDHNVIWTLLGIPKKRSNYTISEVRQGLVELDPDRFKPTLADYADPRKIIDDILAARPSRKKFDSYYFSEERGAALDANRRLLLELLVYHPDGLGITHLDQVSDQAISHRRMWGLLGIQKQGQHYRMSEIRRGLAVLDPDRFKPSLAEYKDTDKIIDDVIAAKSSSRRFDSYYFSEDCAVRSDNRRLLLETKVYDPNELGITHLDQITSEYAEGNRVLWSLLGIERNKMTYQITEVREGLAELDPDRFSPSLAEYGDSETIVRYILARVLEPTFHSYYFGDTCPSLEENRTFLLESEAFSEYLLANQIDLNDLGRTVTTNRDRRVFEGLLGIDIDSSQGLSRLLQGVGSRKIVTRWSDSDNAQLTELAEAYDTPDSLLEALERDRAQLEEQFDRSIYAITLQLERMGLLPQVIRFGPPTGELSSVIMYPFPQVLGLNSLEYTRNASVLLDSGVTPRVVSAFIYEGSGHEQLVHATVPIRYKGIDLADYNDAEACILSLVNTYISNHGEFTETSLESELRVLNPPSITNDDVRILAVHDPNDEDRLFTQIIYRKPWDVETDRPDPNFQVPDTHSILYQDNRELYVFRVAQADVSFANTRR